MRYPTYLWIARVLWIAVVCCFILAMSGAQPRLFEPVAPLAVTYLLVASRARRLRLDQPCVNRV